MTREEAHSPHNPHNREIVNSYAIGYNQGKIDAKIKFIEKACEWLKLNTNWNDEWDEMGRNMNYGMIEEFRKAMEGYRF